MSLEDLGLPSGSTEVDVQARYKELAKEAHPDRGGSTERFQKLKEQRDAALQEVRLGASLARARLQLDALREAARGTVCPRCDGSGYAMQRSVGFRTMKMVCRLCRGRGRL